MLTPPVPVIRMPDAAGALSAADPLVGIDIVAIRRIRSSLERFGDRFVDRLYTPGEAAYAMAAPACRAQRLAARFAAGALSARDIARILAAGLKGAGEPVTVADVEGLGAEESLAELAAVAGELLAVTFGEAEGADPSP